jgi:hypothetical protein
MTLRVKHFTEQVKRLRIARAEYFRNILKSVLYDQEIPLNIRFKLVMKLSKMSRRTFIRAKNRCINSNRAKKCYTFF